MAVGALRTAALPVLLAACVMPQIAVAQEATTYTYDAKGRVVKVVRTGGPSNGVQTDYAYDPADNRTNVTTSGSTNNDTPTNSGGGASTSTAVYVTVPLNGYVLVVVSR